MLKSMFIVLAISLGLSFLVLPNNVKAAQAYDYILVDQQPSTAITMDPGESRTFWVELKNTGTETWNNYTNAQNPMSLGTGSVYDSENRGYGYTSLFTSSVISENGSVNRFGYFSDGVQSLVIIKSGWNTRIQFKLTAPYAPGHYKEYFTPVVEGITWMKDIGIYWDITVTDQWQNKTVNLFDGQILLKSKIGDTVRVHSSDINSLVYNKNILSYTAPSNYCYNSVNCQTTYDFQVIGSGYTSIDGDGFSASVIAERGYYYYEGDSKYFVEGSGWILTDVKKGDIMIVRALNWEQPMTYYTPTVTSGKSLFIKHKSLDPISILVGDKGLMTYGFDEWVFDILDTTPTNYIAIPASWGTNNDGSPSIWNRFEIKIQ